MSMYSFEDKCFIEQFIAANSLDVFSMENEEKWQELGSLMNRDWEDIRKMYQHWKLQDNESESTRIVENNDHMEYRNPDYVIDELILSANESNSCDMFEFLNINGLTETNQIQYVEYVPLKPINNQIERAAQSSSEKRRREVLEIGTNTDLVRIFKKQSITELELKRQEHEKKMMVYKQQLTYGAELHKERMKILKAKLKAIEEKVENIDNMICNKNLKKKFKSGPI